MTTNAEPSTPAKPVFRMQAGVQYQPGSITWLTPDVVAAVTTAPDAGGVLVWDGTGFTGAQKRKARVFTEYHRLLYGILEDDHDLCGYPCKPGTYAINVWVSYEYTDSEGVKTRRQHTAIAADLVVTGTAIGNWFDREVLHFVSPTAVAAEVAAEAAATQAATAQRTASGANATAAAAQRTASAAQANVASIKEDQDRWGQRIAGLMTRVLALEAASPSRGEDDNPETEC